MAEEEVQAGEGTEEPKKKSKMMLFVILGVALAVLGGGGFFAYTKFLAPPPTLEEETPEVPTDLPDPFGEIVTLEPFVVNLSDPKGKRYLKMKISLEIDTETPTEEITEKINRLSPKLRNIVIMMLTSLSFEEVMTPEGKLRIRDELLERFNRVTRPDKIKNIYFSEFVVQ